MTVKHRYVNPFPDNGDPVAVGPPEWNDTHLVANLQTIYTASQALVWGVDETVRTNPSVADITMTLPTAIGHGGERITVKRINASAFLTTLATSLGQTIDGLTSYILGNQWQFVVVESDNANWMIVGGN